MSKPIDAFGPPIALTAASPREGTSGAAARADHDHSTAGLGGGGGGGAVTGTQIINDALGSTSTLLTALNGTWGINAGVLRQSNATGGQVSHISHATAVTPASARIVEVECSYVSGAGNPQRMGLIVSSSNIATTNLLVYANTADGGVSWQVVVEQDATVAYTTTAIPYGGSGYLKLGAVLTGTAVDVYAAGVWYSVTNPAFVPGKYVGLYTYGAAADFRNLKAWAPMTAPP